MADPQPGPSGLCRSRSRHNLVERNVFSALMHDVSDEEDDFDHIPHVSDHDDSSSSDSEVESDRSGSDADESEIRSSWMPQAPETHTENYPLSFTVRNNKSARNIPDNTEKLVDFFQLFLTDDLIRDITEKTNTYAARFLGTEEIQQWIVDHKFSRYKKWPIDGISSHDVKKYIGLALNMGLIVKKNEKHYWTIRKSQETPFFGNVMPMWFYSLISRMLHVSDPWCEISRGQPGYDPWYKIRPMLDAFNSATKRYYIPSQHISIDESLIGMKNRSVFIQYMPNKHHACFGIKKFQLCDDNGYIYCVHFGDMSHKRSHQAQIGISAEPLSQLSQQTPASHANASSVPSFVEFSNKMLENFFNYASSFALTQSQKVPNPSENFVPLSTLKTWYDNFQRKLQHNPFFWKS